MTLSLYDASVPVFQQFLTNATAYLTKAEEYAETKQIDPAVLMASRLAPDMLPLNRQIHLSSDFAKGASGRLAGVTAPRMADTEVTFAEIKQRIQATQDFIASLTPAQFVGSETREVSFPVGPNISKTMSGQEYLLTFALPNFFFHITAAYAILRHNGVSIGKRDFIGGGIL